jgi:DNA-binding transcriptional LysR family regulator
MEARHKLSITMLSALEALYICRKTTLAAEKLGLTQPSLSVYLQQLREASGDELFVRTSKGLEPTEFCHAYYLRAKEVLNAIELLSQRETVFDPLKSSARFSVATSFVKGRAFFDRLSVAVMKQFPKLHVDMIYMPEKEALRGLDTGLVDVFVGMVSEKLEKHYSAVKLTRSEMVAICSTHSPFYKSGRISKAEYLETPHIKASSSFEPSLLDAKFRKAGMLQKTLVSVPDVAAEVALLRETHFLAVVDRSDVELIGEGQFKVLKTDFSIPQFDIFCVWHSRKTADAAHKWYREHIATTCGDPRKK